MRLSIEMKRSSNAFTAQKPFLKEKFWKDTIGHTREKNLSTVSFAVKHLHLKVMLKDMRHATLGKRSTNALSVRKPLLFVQTEIDMKNFTRINES